LGTGAGITTAATSPRVMVVLKFWMQLEIVKHIQDVSFQRKQPVQRYLFAEYESNVNFYTGNKNIQDTVPEMFVL
jgi:hypothetical protein